MFGAIAGGIASALAGGAMSKLFGGGQKAASGGIQGDVLATDNNTVGMGDAGIKSAFAAEGLTKRSAVGFLLRSLIMFQTFISRHNSNFFSDKLVLTSVTPASSAPVLQTPKATSSTLYFDSLTVNAGIGGFLQCIQMDTSVNAANQVVSVGADIAFDADPNFFAWLFRFESSSVPTTVPTAYDVYRLGGRHGGGYYTVMDWVTLDVLPRTPGRYVCVGVCGWCGFTAVDCRGFV